jgi:hypothetical protein
MVNREKVIKGANCCITRLKKTGTCGFECPYKNNPLGCKVVLLKDVLSIATEQEPRVMTLDEVIKHYSLPPVVLDDLNWQEDYLQDIEPLYFDFPVEDSLLVHWRGYNQAGKYINDWEASYGQKWRCWTSRPSDEQREAVKWDE